MDEQQIENLADILVTSLLAERTWGSDETTVIVAARPMVIRLFGEETWDAVEEKFREFVMELDREVTING